MRVPQVSERIKEAPAQALRGVFAVIGQLLLITDKLRHKTPTYQSVPQTRPEPSETAVSEATGPLGEAAAPAPAQPAAPEVAPAAKLVKPPQARDFDKTGNVRLLDAEEGTAAAADSEPAAESKPAPPLANYDELSIASLRARLRNLDLAQVSELTEYERAHEARAEVIGMFEGRIARLEAEG